MPPSLPAQLAHLDQAAAHAQLRAFAQAQGVMLSETQVATILATAPATEPAQGTTALASADARSGYEGMDALRVLSACVCITSVTSIGLVQMFGLSHPLALAGGVATAIGIMGPMLKGSWTHLRRVLRAAKASA